MKRKICQSFWQGVIKLFVLHQAALGPVYGGKLSKSLGNLGHTISPGTLYPTLHNLESVGLLRSYLKVFKGRVRRYYEITAEGQSCLNEVRETLDWVVKSLFLAGPTPTKDNNYPLNSKHLAVARKGKPKAGNSI
jgi:PadR family transcriptional regulator PadR